MSGEDDTFDIDIYGDEGKENQQANMNEDEDNLVFDDDPPYGYDGQQDSSHDQNGVKQEQDSTFQQAHGAEDSSAQPHPQQGTKRKAEDDGYDDYSYQVKQETPSASNFTQPINPSATPALKITELHWWTTEEDLRAFCASANAETQLRDLSFGEHKINGKSRGEVYLEFSSAAAADAVKREVEKKEAKTENEEPKRINNFHIFFTAVGNPFRGRDSGAQGKKDFNNASGGRGGAYNPNFGGGRGNFQRGGSFNRGGFNNRGGGFQQQGGWNQGMGGGYGAPNPMMGAPMMMGMGGMGMGFNNMGRGGGMNMGRGGMMGGMNMGMGGRGGMMGRGGWGGGGGNFQQGVMQGGYGGGAYGMGMQGGANKRMKNE